MGILVVGYLFQRKRFHTDLVAQFHRGAANWSSLAVGGQVMVMMILMMTFGSEWVGDNKNASSRKVHESELETLLKWSGLVT